MEQIYKEIINEINSHGIIGTIKSKKDFRYLLLKSNKNEVTLKILFKNNLNLSDIYILEQVKEYNQIIIFSEYINKNIRKELKDKNICYADLSGNIYINYRGLLIYIEKNRPAKKIPEIKNTFTRSGLKLIFNIIINENLLNKNYREISAICGVSLDTISRVFNDFKRSGNIVQINKHTKQLNRKSELISKLVSFYPEILKPKIIRSRYKSLNNNFDKEWKKTKFNIKKTRWGGEAAANIVTNYISPNIFTIYTSETNIELLKNYKLMEDHNGNIQVVNAFYDLSIADTKNYPENVVHPLIIFAELANSNNSRITETAEIIYKKYINEYI